MLNPFPIFCVLFGVFIIFFFVLYSAAFADDFDVQRKNITNNLKAQQNLLNEREELIRQKELDEFNKISKSGKKKEQNLLEKESDLDGGLCRVIDDFLILGNKKFSSKKLERKILKKYKKKLNNCFNKVDLNNLRKEIENFYLKKGFILARVYFDFQNLEEKSLKIIIEEGKIDNFEIKDNSKINEKFNFRRNLQKFSAFGFTKEKVFNLRDVEQGLEQINRLSSQDAKMQIEPAKEQGYSNVIIENNVKKLTNLSLGFDNAGNQRTGKNRYKIALNQDNLFGFNDNIFINYTKSGDFESGQGFSKSVYAMASIPFGYWNFGASYSNSNYLLVSKGQARSVRSSGNSEHLTYFVERVLLRGQKYKISLKTELEKNDTDSYLEDTYIPINSRENSAGNIYLTNIFYLKNASIYLQPRYSKGLEILGVKIDDKNLRKNQPRAQFNSYGLYGQVNVNFNIKKLELPLNYKITFDSTYSEDSLYGNNQFAIGGRYTLRGFQQSVISGDSGYYVKNDLKTSLSNLLPKKLNNLLTSRTSFGVFYDYGYVRNKVIDEVSDEGYMSGTGFGFNYYGKNLTCDLSYAKGLKSPSFLQNVDKLKKENDVVYFSMNLNF